MKNKNKIIIAIFAIASVVNAAEYVGFEGNYKMAELSPGIIHEYKEGKLVHKFTPLGIGSIRTFKKSSKCTSKVKEIFIG